jgi:hypothetical protein
MMMELAARIECRSARWAHCLAVQVLADNQLGATSTAQNRLFSEFRTGPSFSRMVGFRFVAVKTGKVGATALEFNRHDIDLTSIVATTGARIYLDASYWNSPDVDLHTLIPADHSAVPVVCFAGI